MAKTKTATKHACAMCGRLDVAERMVFSSFTHARYCRDLNACDRRRARRRHDHEED